MKVLLEIYETEWYGKKYITVVLGGHRVYGEKTMLHSKRTYTAQIDSESIRKALPVECQEKEVVKT